MAGATAEPLLLREGDRDRAGGADPVEFGGGRGWRSGRGSCCWPPRARRTPRSPAGRGDPADGEHCGGPAMPSAGMAGLADEERPGRPRRWTSARIIAATLTPPPARLGVTHWSSRLLADRLELDHATVAGGVEAVRGEAVEGGDVQVLHRPRAGGQGHRRHRAVSGAAGERDRAVCGREVPDPGVGPDPEDAADAARACRAAHPRLRPARHHHLVRRAGDRHREGHRAVQEPAPAPGVPGLPQARRPRLPRPASCTW